MPQTTTTPVTPSIAPTTEPAEEPKLFPDEICPQQRREHAAPDVEP